MKPLSITRFSPNYEDLVRLYKKEKHAKQKVRYHAMVLMHEINNCTEVAHIVKKSSRSIQIWVNDFNEKGLEGIRVHSPPERPSSLSPSQLEELKRDLLTSPRKLGYDFSNWEGKSLRHHIKQKFAVEFKIRRCQYLLHEFDFTLQRPRYAFPKADSEKKEQFKKDFKKE